MSMYPAKCMVLCSIAPYAVIFDCWLVTSMYLGLATCMALYSSVPYVHVNIRCYREVSCISSKVSGVMTVQ